MFCILSCLTTDAVFAFGGLCISCVFALSLSLFASKATGAYMPLELVYPQDMLEGVLKEVKPPVVLTEVCVRHT